MTTVGVYSGPNSSGSNADFRSLFTVRANQMDGLGTILKYCQEKVGFTVGSTNTLPFRIVLSLEFANIFHWQSPLNVAATSKAIEKLTAEGVAIEDDPDIQAVYVPPYPPAYYKFLESLRDGGWSYKSLIVFNTKVDGDHMSFVIDENHVIRVGSQQGVTTAQYTWIVDRDEMAKQADWLVQKLKLKDSLEEWNRRITSPGY